ncbi:PREDICTED: cytochrome b-c1 complex subunit 10-like [Dinoponera quadriceps]|uniref:Cytochrome b-c1 complex subunit 10-like n=1 Tax=Dinoponera quadriceps TaxID=609295 RepID=A0A6P3XZC4_DINQU|nr:PREDICTED: cytochrome b-c1 complex subunit 10-like [Dinoponera quadriceps]
MALRLTKTHFELAGKWLPTAMTYGTGASLTFLYLTDWKVVLQYVPFYGSKFDEQS